MAWQLRALSDLVQDQGSFAAPVADGSQLPMSPAPENTIPLWPLWAPNIYGTDTEKWAVV